MHALHRPHFPSSALLSPYCYKIAFVLISLAAILAVSALLLPAQCVAPHSCWRITLSCHAYQLCFATIWSQMLSSQELLSQKLASQELLSQRLSSQELLSQGLSSHELSTQELQRSVTKGSSRM